MRKILNLLPLLCLALIICAAIVSWIGSYYGMNCRNLLTDEGGRWAVAMVMQNLGNAPWGYVVLATSTVSIIAESGIVAGLGRPRSLKQNRAYMIVVLTAFVIALIITVLALIPGNKFLSAFGTFHNSSLEKGLFPLVCFFLTAISVVFAFAIGRFSNMADVWDALVRLPVGIATYFITFFFVSQFIAVLLFGFYMDYNPTMDIPLSVRIFEFVMYGLPLLAHCVLYLKQHE